MTSLSPITSNKPGELLGMFYSPFTERARWVLDHHRLPYKYTEYLMMLGDPILHWKARSLDRNLTVPLFIHSGRRIRNSYDIARYVDQIGTAKKLFPVEKLAEIERWNHVSEAICNSARSVVVNRLKTNPDAQVDHLPKILPDPLDGILRSAAGPIAKLAIRYLERSFDIQDDLQRQLAELRKHYSTLRKELNGKPYLFETLSYADITMAVCMQALEPVSEPFLKLGVAAREVWRIDELAQEFADLIEWRNALYANHRASKRN